MFYSKRNTAGSVCVFLERAMKRVENRLTYADEIMNYSRAGKSERLWAPSCFQLSKVN